MTRTLGLDLGPNSIGWAIIEEHEDSSRSKIIDMGVRVFPEGVEAFGTSKEKSKNEDRRIKRGMRRQTKRRARRERLFESALTKVGLWPSLPEQRTIELSKNPYSLRERAIQEPLTAYELGRVFLHLCRRRGFLSNRKKDNADQEAKGMLAEIEQNERNRLEGGHETIGAYLAAKYTNLKHNERTETDNIRNRHIHRRQIADEFLKIWDFQKQYHEELLSDKNQFGELGPVYTVNPKTGKQELSLSPRRSISRYSQSRNSRSDLESFGLFGIMFFQRPMYWPMSVVGQCEFEPNQKRCPKSDRIAERFRILQELNNLRYFENGEEVALSEPQRKAALNLLSKKDVVTFESIRKKLNLHESAQFNLERGSRSSLKGNTIDHKIAKTIGKSWHDRDEHEKTLIVRLMSNDNVEEFHKIRKLNEVYGFTIDEAEKLVAVDLPPGYVNLSRRAIERLLPHLEKGLVFQSTSDPESSAIHAAGYYRRDELQRRIFDFLPDLTKVNPGDCRIGNIPNPVVKRALFELRKVVNAIIREYGKPDNVHIELARDVQVGAEKRKEISRLMREREKERDRAAREISNHGHAVRREGIIRYLLWEEQKHECIYCGKPLSMSQLFGGDVDIDHILPYSRCLDDSQANKVVAHRECNQKKGQQTPYEWLASSQPKEYDRVVQQVTRLRKEGVMSYSKFSKFLQKELDLDKFIARQLVDTGYISRLATEYLQLLFDKPSQVLGLKGRLTAELRWQWGLDTVLSELPDSPAWVEDKGLIQPNGEKNRADHRHHAIDALVVALTNRRRLQMLTKLVKRGGAKQHGEVLEEPWSNFRETVSNRVKIINVSFRVQRKVTGRLHEETNYGKTDIQNEWVVRKPVVTLTASEVEKIRDATIRELVLKTLSENGIEFGRGKKIDEKKMKEILSNLTMPSGVPVKKVRITKPDQTIMALHPEREDTPYVKPGNTHHLCIFEFSENGKTKREAVFVTMLEATNRIKRRECVIQRKHPIRPDAKFLMSLSSRELIYIMNENGEDQILVFKTAASTQGQIYFCSQYDARRSSCQKEFVFKANTIRGKKITVDPLGRIRWAND